MFHQDRDEFIVARATVNARFANSLRLMPGDRVNITGQLSQQELSLGNGEKKLVNRLIVSDIVVIEKAERKSITVYEQKRGR
jgi:DNA replicative helicase MCM subunit Mcm2 (Cdc46/Mcm family)